MQSDTDKEALEVATLAGHILLENGAEISRVEETMERIASRFGVDSSNFFVLSNGIFTTSQERYAKVEFIPFKGAQLERVVAVNQLSRDIQNGKYTISEAKNRLCDIRTMMPKKWIEQVLGSAVGSAGFCIIFGGGLPDAAAAFVVGLLLWLFVFFVSAPHMSKILGNITGAALATACCMAFREIGFGVSLGNMIIGSIIPLIPGIPFINGIRDFANEDYIAGTTRLLDALMVFFCIALGVSVSFLADGWIRGSLIELDGALTDPVTSSAAIQLIASFAGTVGFAVLFGVPSGCYVSSGTVATAGWMLYLTLVRNTGLGLPVSTFFAATLVAALSRWFSRIKRTPGTVFVITGIFPMVPGGGLFWTTYFIVSKSLHDALSIGFLSVKVSIAIVLALVVVNEIPSRFFRKLIAREKESGNLS